MQKMIGIKNSQFKKDDKLVRFESGEEFSCGDKEAVALIGAKAAIPANGKLAKSEEGQELVKKAKESKSKREAKAKAKSKA